MATGICVSADIWPAATGVAEPTQRRGDRSRQCSPLGWRSERYTEQEQPVSRSSWSWGTLNLCREAVASALGHSFQTTALDGNAQKTKKLLIDDLPCPW